MEINKQTEIYKFIKNHTENKGYPPSIREICKAVSLSSTSTVHGHLQRLERKGMIKRDPTKPRAIEIVELSTPKKEMIHIPIIGKIKVGSNILDPENIEGTFPIPLDYIEHNKELFMIRVSGQSMINVGIRDSDLAIIENTEHVINGDIVATFMNDETTIKRFFKEKDHIKLQSENDTMDTIRTTDCKILGKLVGIFRSYK